MTYSEWRRAVLAAVEGLVIGIGYSMLQYVEVAYAMAQRRPAECAG